jgi:hypothetical protein
MLVYLSGAIEYAPDHGKTWRAALTPFLLSLGHEVYDPAMDEKKNLTDVEMREFRSWKRNDLPRFQATLRKIIAYDLDWIEQRADCVVAFWDEHAQRGAGSQAEVTLAHRRGIPVYLVAGVPVEQVSGWILGCSTEVFTGFDQLHAFLGLNQAATAPKLATRDRDVRATIVAAGK